MCRLTTFFPNKVKRGVFIGINLYFAVVRPCDPSLLSEPGEGRGEHLTETEIAVNLLRCLKQRHGEEDWKPKWKFEGEFIWLTGVGRKLTRTG